MKKGRDKFEKVMSEFKKGILHSGSKKGPKVQNPKQAIAIAFSEERRLDKTEKGKGGMKKQSKKSRMDESLGERKGKESEKMQSYSSRRKESKGARKK